MTCHDFQDLWGLYYDQELDPEQMEQVQRHRRDCVACDRFFRTQEQFHTALAAALQQGKSTPSLWQSEEAAIRQAIQTAEIPIPRQRSRLEGFANSLGLLGQHLIWPSPKYYGALASIWVVLLIANYLLTVGANVSVATTRVPASLAQTQSSFSEYRRELLIELANKESDETKAIQVTPPSSEKQHRSSTEPSAKDRLLVVQNKVVGLDSFSLAETWQPDQNPTPNFA